jgi:hypothetical protein
MGHIEEFESEVRRDCPVHPEITEPGQETRDQCAFSLIRDEVVEPIDRYFEHVDRSDGFSEATLRIGDGSRSGKW